MSESIKLTNAALDTLGNGDIIVRGVLDHRALHLIKCDNYQREVLSMNRNKEVIHGLKTGGRVPDVTLGMRGGDFTDEGDGIRLRGPIYVIDGLQRISCAMHLMQTNQKPDPRLGAIVYFNTTKHSEDELFTILNTHGTRLSPNVLLRNARETSRLVEMIYNLTFDSTSSLYGRITWQQSQKRGELLTALILLKVNNQLHSTFGPGKSCHWEQAVAAGERTLNNVGRLVMRDNLKMFFELIDEAWGMRKVTFNEGATWLRGGFLLSLALVIAHHKNFWDEHKRLVLAIDMRRKIAGFPINDPQVSALTNSPTRGASLLYQLIVNHVNSGRRTGHLVPFKKSDQLAAGREADAVQQGVGA